MGYEIKYITAKTEMLCQLPLLQQLQPWLNEKNMSEMLDDMLPHGYVMAGVFDGNKCVAITGLWFITKFYSGKYMEIDNFVTDENYRSKGLGKLLTDWCMTEAKKKNCRTVMLDAYTTNHAGHKFYLREGFIIKGYHFLKEI